MTFPTTPSTETAVGLVPSPLSSTPFKLTVRAPDGSMVFKTDLADDAARRVETLLRDLPGKERRNVLRDVRQQVEDQRRKERAWLDDAIAMRERELGEIGTKLEATNCALSIINELRVWTQRDANANPRLERTKASRAHVLRAAIDAERIVQWSMLDGSAVAVAGAFEVPPIGQVFVVEHDWAAAFKGAEDYEERDREIHLPFENVCFEFTLSGKHVCALASATAAADHDVIVAAFVELKHSVPDAWLFVAPDQDVWRPVLTLIGQQIKAICVALDAEVAETEVVRAPHRLNHARERAGKIPLYDYHVVKLARRSRTAPLPDGGEHAGGRKRLHFRRGHWRHYEKHKTWLKWNLVGDPDLGFIDKQYRL